MSPLRVLITGNLSPWELPASYCRAFASLGHQVEVFDWYGRLERAARPAPERASRWLLTVGARRWGALEFLACVRRLRPDLIFLIKTDDLPTGTLAVARTIAPECRIVAFHPDDPYNIHRIRGPSHPRSLSQVRAVDHYFIWSKSILEELRRLTRAVSYLGFACDPEFTRPIPLSAADHARFDTDVSFIGNWAPKREAWLAPLAHSTSVRLTIWGESDWCARAHDSAVGNCWRGPALGDDFVRAVLCSRASINVLRPQNERAENMRTYEIPGCGGVMLAEWSPQQAEIFREGTEALYAKSPEDLADLARQLVARPGEARSSIAAAALRRATEQTYRARAQTILEALGYSDRRKDPSASACTSQEDR